MQYQFHNIPQELRDFPQWIVWRKETRKGKTTKVPYKADGRHAKANDKQHWTTFENAVKAYETQKFDGIGFMFSKDDPFVGIDLDHCIQDGAYSDDAKRIVDQLDSYTELSPSGDGLHIIVKGKLPLRGTGTGKRKGGIEVYRHGRYFTFTGNSVGLPTVEERTDALKSFWNTYMNDAPKPQTAPLSSPQQKRTSDLNENDLWDKMFASKNGSKIKDLFDGFFPDGDHSEADMALCNYLAFWTDCDAALMDSMFRQSGLMREKWDAARGNTTYGAYQIEKAIAECSSTVSDHVPQKDKPYNITINSDESEFETKEFNLTELGNAERIAYKHGKDIRYCNEVGWLIWDGKKWAVDETRKIETIVSGTLRGLYDEAFKESDEDRQKAMLKWAKICEKRSTRVNSIQDLRPLVPVLKKDLDKHKMLFNCQNGVIDLETGKLLPHKRELLLTQISNTSYDKDAQCPNWESFLKDVILNDKGETDYEVIDYVQKALGYSLTGSMKEQAMFFLYGTGKNGKSTFIDTVQEVFGDYGKQSNTDTFVKKKNDSGINNDIARLDGARFVSAVESEEGQQLSEALVKQITGGDKIAARFMRQDFFEFAPEFKVFFTTNHKPIVRNNDDGIWRRIHLIPFTASIPKEKQDKDLPEKLRKELPGILRWMVEGALKWQAEGLEKPSSVERATQSYREDMDILGPFIDELCIVNPLAKVEAKKLFREYKQWSFGNDEIDIQNRKFYRMIESRGFKKFNGAKNKVYFSGLGLKEENKSLENVKGVNELSPRVNKEKDVVRL